MLLASSRGPVSISDADFYASLPRTPTFRTLAKYANALQISSTPTSHLIRCFNFDTSDHNLPTQMDGTETFEGTNARPSKRQRTSQSGPAVINPLQCQVCFRVYERADHLNRHLDSHRNERSFRCGKCPATFNRKYVYLESAYFSVYSYSKLRWHAKKDSLETTSCLSCKDLRSVLIKISNTT